jgi:hypothetical protein
LISRDKIEKNPTLLIDFWNILTSPSNSKEFHEKIEKIFAFKISFCSINSNTSSDDVNDCVILPEKYELISIDGDDNDDDDYDKKSFHKTIIENEKINYVGELQQKQCVLLHKIPIYKFKNEKFLFTATCIIDAIQTTGIAPNKKKAKQLAAKRMISILNADDV